MVAHRRTTLFLLLLAAPVFGATTSDISSGSDVNGYVERLEAYGCVRPELRVFGPREYGEIQGAIIPSQPRDTADEDGEGGEGNGQPGGCTAPEWLLIERDLLGRPANPFSASAAMVALPQDTLPLLGLGSSITPLFPLKDGRLIRDGENLFLEMNLNTSFGRTIRLAAGVTPGWVGDLSTAKNAFGNFYLQEGYVKLGYRQAELTYGRVALRFGETAHGSLLLSGASAPFNLLKFDIRPHHLGFLGSFSFQTFVTTATASPLVNNTHFWGVGIGARPADWMELALLEMFQFGGDGVPGMSFSDVLQTAFYSGADDLALERQRTMALHTGFWFPDHYAKLYAQFMFDSLGAVSDWFSDDVSVLTGLWFPKIGNSEIRLEYVHTVPSAYRSSLYGQGLTYLATPIGSPLGADAQGIYLDGGLPPFGKLRTTLRTFYEQRGITLAPSLGQSPESRYGLGVDLSHRWVRTVLTGSLTYAYAVNHRYVPGQNDSLVGVGLALTYTFL